MNKKDFNFSGTESTEELADMAVEQLARFFWEYWHYMKKEEKKNK